MLISTPFFVEVDTGSGFQTIYETFGPGPQTDHTDPWVEEEVNLTPFAGSTALQIRFRSIRGTSFRGDMALDDISVDLGPPCSKPGALSVVSVSTTDVTLDWVPNSGISWEIAYGAPWFQPDSAVGSPNGPIGIVPTGTHPFTITGLTAGINYHFYVREACAAVPGANSNWRGPAGTYINCVPVTAPWSDSFEAGLSSCWIQSSTDQLNWEQNSGSSSTFNTGPSAANDGSQYIYVGTTGSSAGDKALIQSPPVDITTVTNPALIFDYHMYGAGMGWFHVMVDSANTGNIDTLFAIYGDQGNQWNNTILSLAGYEDPATGVVSVQFELTVDDQNGFPFENDLALDHVRIDGQNSTLIAGLDSSGLVAIACNGGTASATVTASGGMPPYSYLWSDGSMTPTATLSAGTYTVTVSDNSATSLPVTVSLTLTEPAELMVTIDIADPGTLTANVTGGTQPYTYLWSTIPPQTTPTATGLAPDTYTVTVTDANGCSDTAQRDTFFSIEELNFARHISLYPNPTAKEVFIDYDFTSEVDLEVTVVNHLGQVVLTISEPNTVSGQLRLEVAEWANGVYSVLFSNGSQSSSRQLVIQK